MAGEWIPMRLDLGTDPAVVSVALTLDMDEYAVVGRLHKLWVWANQHTLNGHAKGVTENWLDRFLSAPGFTSALENAGWLKVENDGVRVPKFDLWNSQGAKRRLDASKRQQKARSTRHTSVTKMSQDSVTPVTKKCDKSVTRVEESREEKRREEKEQIPFPPVASDDAKPAKPKPPQEPKPKTPRQPNLLFDAIAEASGLDPSTAGGRIGNVAASLANASTPYTPDDVRQFAKEFWIHCSYAAKDGRTRPTPNEIEINIGLIRAKPAPTQTPPSTNNATGTNRPTTAHRVEPTPGKYSVPSKNSFVIQTGPNTIGEAEPPAVHGQSG